jgi:dUTP pyrophosphatase
MSKLKIYCSDSNCRPQRAHPTDAGIDLRARGNYFVGSEEITKVHTGVHVEIPVGYVGLVFPRSGLARDYGVTLANTVGVIDSDYRGEIICLVQAREDICIEQYSRFAQMVVVPCLLDTKYVEDFNKLSNTKRGDGGFGHTGKH